MLDQAIDPTKSLSQILKVQFRINIAQFFVNVQDHTKNKKMKKIYNSNQVQNWNEIIHAKKGKEQCSK